MLCTPVKVGVTSNHTTLVAVESQEKPTGGSSPKVPDTVTGNVSPVVSKGAGHTSPGLGLKQPLSSKLEQSVAQARVPAPKPRVAQVSPRRSSPSQGSPLVAVPSPQTSPMQ